MRERMSWEGGRRQTEGRDELGVRGIGIGWGSGLGEERR